MKISEIKKFLSRIEKALNELKINYVIEEDFYYCSKDGKHCVVIPYISTMDFSFPDYKNCFNYVIVSNGDIMGNDADVKFLTINDLETVVLKCKSNHFYTDIVNLFFFNSDLVRLSNDHDLTKYDLPTKTVKGKSDELKKNNDQGYRIDIESIGFELGCVLTKDKYLFSSENLSVFATLSKSYRGNVYWYAYHDHTKNQLEKCKTAFLSFFFKDRPEFLLLPKSLFYRYIEILNKSSKDGKEWWHVKFRFKRKKCFWLLPKHDPVDVTEYLISRRRSEATVITKKPPSTQITNSSTSVVLKITSNSFHSTKVKKR